MGIRRMLAVAACTVAVAALGAGSALAGEITGNGKWIAGSEAAPLHGKSDCAYSGQNDGDGAARQYAVLRDGRSCRTCRSEHGESRQGRTGTCLTGHPGFACNGDHGFFGGAVAQVVT